jgi:hypothetical protein
VKWWVSDWKGIDFGCGRCRKMKSGSEGVKVKEWKSEKGKRLTAVRFIS